MITIRGENAQEPDGDLDEIWADGCFVHLERMSDTTWCLIFNEHETGREVIVHLGYAKKRKGQSAGGFGLVTEDYVHAKHGESGHVCGPNCIQYASDSAQIHKPL